MRSCPVPNHSKGPSHCLKMSSSSNINIIQCKIRENLKQSTIFVKGFPFYPQHPGAVAENLTPSNFEVYLWFGWPAFAASCGSWFPWHRCAAPLETSFESTWSWWAADFARGQGLGTNENIERSRWVFVLFLLLLLLLMVFVDWSVFFIGFEILLCL